MTKKPKISVKTKVYSCTHEKEYIKLKLLKPLLYNFSKEIFLHSYANTETIICVIFYGVEKRIFQCLCHEFNVDLSATPPT